MDEDWITVKEAAASTGYHPEYIRWLINEGKVEARKFSVVWAVNRKSLLEYIRQGVEKGDPRAGPKGPHQKLAKS